MSTRQSGESLRAVTAFHQPSDTSQMDAAIRKAREAAGKFAGLSLEERIKLARSMQQGYLKIAEKSVIAGCAAKGISIGTPPEGEEWATGPWPVVRQLRLIIGSLTALQKGANTPIGRVGKTQEGNLSVRIFPGSTIDKLLFKNVTVDVHLQNGVNAGQLETGRARFYKQQPHTGAVVLVLGAGNFASIPAMDVLTLMFNEGKVCVLKMNPVNEYLGPLIEEAFATAVDQGFLSIVYGNRREGDYLVRHAGIDEVHITGSDKTFNTIVWGPEGPERNKRIAENNPLLKKKITSELGNVSPIIITPGPYTDRELGFMARDIAGYLMMNASFVCCAAKVLIVPQGWDKREAFLDILADVLAAVPPRKAYYPGAVQRFDLFTQERKRGRIIGDATGENLPWAIISGLDPDRKDEIFFTTEAFCSVLAETAVGSPDPPEFLDKAVDFANNRLWGTLSATLMVHPVTAKDSKTAGAVERAIGRLRYGTVCVNAFPGMSFAFASTPWGGYPGSTASDIQSGQGWVHNTSMLEGIEKVVARFPLINFPKPAYFPGHRTVHILGRQLTALDEKGSWLKVPGIIFTAIRG